MERKELVGAFPRAGRWGLKGDRYALIFTNERLIAAVTATAGQSLKWLVLGGLVGESLQRKREKRAGEVIAAEAEQLNFEEIAKSDPKNIVIPYRDITSVKLYKKMGMTPLVVETPSAEIKFALEQKEYKLAKEVLEKTLKDKLKLKGSWSL